MCNVYLVIITERRVTSKKVVTNDKGGKMCNGDKGEKIHVHQSQAAGKCVISDKGRKVYDRWQVAGKCVAIDMCGET